MILNRPKPVQDLDSVYRRTVEDTPLTVRPYMITEKDLADLGHARCFFDSEVIPTCSSEVPTWFVNGWSVCDHHLSDLIHSAANFNHRNRIWHA